MYFFKGDLEHSVKEEIASYLGIDVSILNRDNNDELMRASKFTSFKSFKFLL